MLNFMMLSKTGNDVMSTGFIATAAVIIVLLLLIVSCIKIVPQANAFVIERLGGYKGTWGVGLHFKMPFFDKIAKKVILKEQVVDYKKYNN